MAGVKKNNNTANLGFEIELWKDADAMSRFFHFKLSEVDDWVRYGGGNSQPCRRR